MKRSLTMVLLLATAGMVGACNKEGGSTPTGQVVATVNGEEITANELNAEMAGARMPEDPKQQQALRNAVLQTIVNRHIVAKAARDQGLDKTPEAAVQRQKLEDLAVIQSLEKQLAAAVPAPSREEAQRYVSEHPNSFAERKIYVVDQIISAPIPQPLLQQLQPLKTLPDIKTLLVSNNVPHQAAVATIDGASADPEMIKRIAQLPAGEVFVVPNQNGFLINQIRESRTDPFTGDRAINTAMAIIKRQRTQEAVGKRIQQLLTEGGAKVEYAEGYKPEPRPSGAPGASAGAPGAAPAAGGAAPAAAPAN